MTTFWEVEYCVIQRNKTKWSICSKDKCISMRQVENKQVFPFVHMEFSWHIAWLIEAVNDHHKITKPLKLLKLSMSSCYFKIISVEYDILRPMVLICSKRINSLEKKNTYKQNTSQYAHP